MDEIVDSCAEFALDQSAAERLLARALDFFALQNSLMKHYLRSEGKLLFNCTFKSHWLLHGVILARHVSPRSLLALARVLDPPPSAPF